MIIEMNVADTIEEFRLLKDDFSESHSNQNLDLLRRKDMISGGYTPVAHSMWGR